MEKNQEVRVHCAFVGGGDRGGSGGLGRSRPEVRLIANVQKAFNQQALQERKGRTRDCYELIQHCSYTLTTVYSRDKESCCMMQRCVPGWADCGRSEADA